MKERLGTYLDLHKELPKHLTFNKPRLPNLFLDPHKVIDMYQVKMMSTKEISEHFDCSSKSILKILKKYNIKIRHKQRKLNLNNEEVIEAYLVKKMTLREVAKQFNCSTTAIRAILKKHNVKTKNISDAFILHDEKKRGL